MMGGRGGGREQRRGRGRGRGGSGFSNSFNFNPEATTFCPVTFAQQEVIQGRPAPISGGSEPAVASSLPRGSAHQGRGGRGGQRCDGSGRGFRGGRSRGKNWRPRHREGQNRGKAEPSGEEADPEEENDVEDNQGGNDPVAESPPSEAQRRPDLRNQREKLADQLSRNAYDCMICVERVRWSQAVWSCSQQCFNVFHLDCLIQWVQSSAQDGQWRCPSCQLVYHEIPFEYRCFCGAEKDPCKNSTLRGTLVPHTCGQPCRRKREGCKHPCGELCHPGPCPPCQSSEWRFCCCLKTTVQIRCSSKSVVSCGATCGKELNCGIHFCTKICHAGNCGACNVVVKLDCYCGAATKEEPCDSYNSTQKLYSCDKQCEKLLSCGFHHCESTCHQACGPCKLSSEMVKTCPCGQTSLSWLTKEKGVPPRRSCLDPIPLCDKICGKKLLQCEHKCQASCHTGPCPTCSSLTTLRCRCGSKTFETHCFKVDHTRPYTCEKRCIKKKSCGKHKCNAKCCNDRDHLCLVLCDKPLRCGNHKCPILCHNGHCPACREVSFDELTCECGNAITYPPIPCGTKRPACSKPCTRNHVCDHPVMHNCHSEPQCPPCTILTEKWCYGKHEKRKNIMCHIDQLSCGLACGKALPCGRHSCPKTCHPGGCLSAGEFCTLPCGIAKEKCRHPCGVPCHRDDPCPDVKCKVITEVSCPCGRRQETLVCWKRENEYERLVIYLKNTEIKKKTESTDEHGEELDEQTVLQRIKDKTPKANILECDRECARVERNRKMMEALKLEDPDATSTFGTPNYSEFLVGVAKKNPQFVESVHDKLTNLVVKAKRSHRKNETFGFESMNRDKRKVVHEYSDHFGCLSESFDDEPNRNVVCTASKEKSYLPSVSLIDAVYRPNMCSERKKTFQDVEIYQNTKSQIMRPANGKIASTPWTNSRVPQQLPTHPAPPSPRNRLTNVGNSSRIPSDTARNIAGADFPPLS